MVVHTTSIVVVLAILQCALPADAQTIAVNTDENVFLCKTAEDCSGFYAGEASQGEW